MTAYNLKDWVFVYQELEHQVSLIRNVAEKVFSEMGSSLSYKVGTMIEIPRAALVADEVSKWRGGGGNLGFFL